jgi:hypothetical protein
MGYVRSIPELDDWLAGRPVVAGLPDLSVSPYANRVRNPYKMQAVALSV